MRFRCVLAVSMTLVYRMLDL